MGQEVSQHRLDQLMAAVEKIRNDIETGRVTINEKEECRNSLFNYKRELETSFTKFRGSQSYNNVKKNIDLATDALNAVDVEGSQVNSVEIRNRVSRSLSRNSCKLKNTDLAVDASNVVGVEEPQLNSVEIRRNRVRRSLFRNFSRESKSLEEIIRSAEEIQTIIKNAETKQLYYEPLQRLLVSYSQQLSVQRNQNQDHEIDAVLALVSSVTEELSTRQAQDNVDSFAPLKIEENKLEPLRIVDQQIDILRTQILTENDTDHLTDPDAIENRNKCLQDLKNIENALVAFNKNLNHQNIEAKKAEFNGYKNQLEAIEEINREVSVKKSEVSSAMLSIESDFSKLESDNPKRCPNATKLGEVRETVESVKAKISNSLSGEELNKLDGRLTLAICTLDNIKDDQLKEEKTKLYKEIHCYSSRIQELIDGG